MPRRGFQVDKQATGSGGIILSANPHRDYLVVSNSGPAQLLLSFGLPADSTHGIFLPPTVQPMIFRRHEIGNIIGLDLYAAAFNSQAVLAPQVLSAVGQALSGAAVGTALSLANSIPIGSVLDSATISNFSGAPTVALQIVRGAATITLLSTTTQAQLQNPVVLQLGDTVRWQVITAVAASTFDATISLSGMASFSEFGALTQVSLLVGEECGMPF